jgi:hypothetical protein
MAGTQQAGQNWNDMDILSDALKDQKFVTANYNTFANECQNPDLRNEVLKLSNEEHMAQADIFTNLHNRGGYPVKAAPQNEISQAAQKATANQAQ